ncbi:unnamed protein product [Ectocarpus sp. 12 AP-2014]
MVRSPSDDATPTPPEPLLSTLPGTTAHGINTNREIFDVEPHPNAESNATLTTAATRLDSLLYKLRMFSLHLFSVVGVLASLSVLAGKTDFRWSLAEKHGHHSSRDINPQSGSGNSSGSLEAHAGDGLGATVGAPLSHEEASGPAVLATSVAPPPAMKKTALLVAVDNETLAVWSDFVSSARKQTPGIGISQKQELPCGNDSAKPDCGISDEEDEGKREEERADSSTPVEEQHDCDKSCFPPVWIVTSDPRVDIVVREDMPHLFSLFVPFDSDGGTDGTGGPNNLEEHSRWADALDRFLSENPEVNVFGVYGEGALPTAALLPDYMDSSFAPSDIAGDGGGGGGSVRGDRSGISSVLWPVLSEAIPPTAVISRARMWWDKGDGGTSNGLGEWMSDKFVAQVWCNRAMLVAAGRDFMNPTEPGLVAKRERTTFLHVIQGLVREPSAEGVVIVDGTKVIPSRYLHPPTKAGVEEIGGDSSGNGGRGQPDRFVFLQRLVQHAREKREHERQQRRDQQQPQPPPGGVKTSGSTAAPVLTPQELQPLPEINYYIGTLELTLGFDLEAMPTGAENTTATARVLPDRGDSPSVTGTTKSGYQSGDDGEGDKAKNGPGANASVATIMRAVWPPEYILDTVIQPLFTIEEEEERATSSMEGLFDRGSWGASQRERKQQGIVIVSSVNCGYLDMASNFLQSVGQAAGGVKVLFVARDEVAFDFLDALSPGCTVFFPEVGSERAHAIQAGQWGDNIFKQQTVARPDILLPILRQGYKALYTDVDIFWLGNVLSLLPNSRVTQTPPVEVMLQADAKQKCTCFMYLDCTPNAIRLLELWKQEIADKSSFQDQRAFQDPLAQMQEAGLALQLLPKEAMLPGNIGFDETYVKNNYALLQDKLLIVHNNWIVGHDPKRKRFRMAGLWEVGDWEFPTCQRRNLRSQGERSGWEWGWG